MSLQNLYKVIILLRVMRWGLLILLGVFFVSFAGAAIPGDCEGSMIAYWQFENDVLDIYGNHDGGVCVYRGTAYWLLTLPGAGRSHGDTCEDRHLGGGSKSMGSAGV